MSVVGRSAENVGALAWAKKGCVEQGEDELTIYTHTMPSTSEWINQMHNANPMSCNMSVLSLTSVLNPGAAALAVRFPYHASFAEAYRWRDGDC